MFLIENLAPEGFRRIPWKNGRGEMAVIDCQGGEGWQSTDWHFGRTAIIESGPFSDYTGYERLQVLIKGTGLVLVAPDHEIDLRVPMRPRRYDGGIPIRTRLEAGPVEVANLIADRARFDINLRVGKSGAQLPCSPGWHIVYSPVGTAQVEIEGRAYALLEDHALRLRNSTGVTASATVGDVLIGSILDKT